MIAPNSIVDLEVFRRYSGLSLPRHVSYPMPTGWNDMDEDGALAMLQDSNKREQDNGLSLYLHIPFCEALCKFCACTRVILKKNVAGAADRVDAYLSAIERDLDRMASVVGSRRVVRQIHWGGGSPTYLSSEQIQRLQGKINDLFDVAPDAEIAMEIDPRTAPPDKLQALRAAGFNRVSLGVQDFSEQVQMHVRRIQPYEMVRETVSVCKALGFESVNFDLIYGLPYQTPATVRDTIEQAIALAPDRVAYYHYAQIPEKIATQRGMDYTKLPDSEVKLEMFMAGVELFGAAGFDFIGLDHFAKSEEGLAQAMEEGTLQRNFQGMTTGGGLDLIGVGASSIGHLAGIGFLQNMRESEDYIACVESGKLPVVRGKRFSDDDRIRQAVISELYCTAEIRPEPIEREFGIVFADYFARELTIMEELQRDGLVILQSNGAIRATMPLGRVLLRTVAAPFDAYLDDDAYRVGDKNCFSANA